MKNLKSVLAFALLVAATTSAAAPQTDLRVVVFGRPPLASVPSPIGSHTDSVVIFLNENLRMALQLVIVPDDGLPASRLASWWRWARVTIQDQSGIVRTFTPADPGSDILEARITGAVVAGSASAFARWIAHPTFVRFSVPSLPPGDYVARAQFSLGGKSLQSNPAVFHIRRGDEDRDVKRLFLVSEAENARAYPDYKRFMLALAQLEPESAAGDIESIAERSLNVAPPEETLSLYKQAHAMREAAAAAYTRQRGDKLTPEERDSINRQLLLVGVFEKLYPEYVRHRSDRRLVVLGAGNNRAFAWQSKKGGLIGLIDSRNPSVVRPIVEHQRVK